MSHSPGDQPALLLGEISRGWLYPKTGSGRMVAARPEADAGGRPPNLRLSYAGARGTHDSSTEHAGRPGSAGGP